MSSQSIHLYLTTEHHCGYIPGRKAINLVPDPSIAMSWELYSQLIELGYRRSGDYTYRPHCNGCDACQPCRIPVKDFQPSKNQRRCARKNLDLDMRLVEARYSDEHFELYRKYINARHSDGQMVNPVPEDFTNFLLSSWGNTSFIELRLKQRLVAVAVTDHLQHGLSAVYSYFDPDLAYRSLGTCCILKQITLAQSSSLNHLYMGYWIQQCQKMSYKSSFQPLEVYDGTHWKPLE